MVSVSRSALSGWVATAALAPSLHNSQPWRFEIDGPVVEVHADHASAAAVRGALNSW